MLGAGSVDEIRAATGLEADRVARAVGRLRAGGLVGAAGGRLQARTDVLKEAAREAAPDPDPADRAETDPVLRVFVRGGKLTSIPASYAKRLVVLDHLAQAFEPGHRYAEREVNATIEGFHPDYATLRRYLVDEGFLNREAGIYWRSGGTFPID